MKKYLLLLLILFVGGCSTADDGFSQEPGDETGKPQDPEETLDYWKNEAAKLGLQVEDATLYLNDKEYYATGVNCYDLFVSGITKDGDKYIFDASTPIRILNVLNRCNVNVLRFSCIEYYAEDFLAYENQREEYLAMLARIAEVAVKLKMGLIPSLYWNFHSVNKYCGEPTRSWGQPNSKTVAFLKNYTKDVVSTLARYKSIFAWEFGNEINLAADLPNWQDAFDTTDPNYWFKGDDLCYAFRTFIQTVQDNDPSGRAIFSGHANLRNSQYNQYTNNSWNTDSKEQFKLITDKFTPEGMQVSEHIYELSRSFSDLGTVYLAERLRLAKSTAATLGKAYLIGEFGGATFEEYKTYYEAMFTCGIQLSLVWNFSINGDIEHSFTTDSEKGQFLFDLIKTYNQKFEEVYK